MMTTRLLISDSPTERVPVVEQLRRLSVHECAACDDGLNLSSGAVKPAESSRERAADDAFLNPRRAFGEFPVSCEAREFGTRARAAGRTVVGFAGALDEVARVCAGDFRRAEQLDVIHFGKTLRVNRLSNTPAVICERVHVFERELLAVVCDEVKPIPAPRDIASHFA